jgi:hypothetical protein
VRIWVGFARCKSTLSFLRSLWYCVFIYVYFNYILGFNDYISMAGFKFKNYISYAIGEIILVVIGILIAVGINNWN